VVSLFDERADVLEDPSTGFGTWINEHVDVQAALAQADRVPRRKVSGHPGMKNNHRDRGSTPAHGLFDLMKPDCLELDSRE
jgi:hypothetical protein